MTKATEIKAAQHAAREIYQGVLDRMTDAIMSNDEVVLIDGVSYPFRQSTLKEEFIIESPADWLACTTRFVHTLRSQGVNSYIRLVTDADFLSENYITGRHVTHTMRNANVVVPAYENSSTLVRSGGVWRFSEMESAIENHRWPISTVHINRVDESARRIGTNFPSDDSDIRRNSASPLSLYQAYLDELSAINMAGDFDAWCEKCVFPHSVHIEQVDEIIETPEHIRPFLEMMSDLIRKNEVDTLYRRADHAEFISATQLCGYHTTTFLSKGEVKVGPVLGRYILERTGTSWRMVSVTNSLSNTEFPYSQPEPGDALVTLREIQERTTKS